MADKKYPTEAIKRFCKDIYPSEDDVKNALEEGRTLRIYLGVDPTGPHLHLGHATNLLLLKTLQDLGHDIIFLIGDFTAKIGDPTGKESARKPLTDEEIKKNLKTFKDQAGKIIDFEGENAAEIKFNSKWLSKLNFEDLINISSHFTVQQMIKRDMFRKRIEEDRPISLHEFFYPLMQGYDSVAMEVDMEIGGTDQTFNMLRGRDLLKEIKDKEKFVLTTHLLENPESGQKLMNKSEGGLINLDDKPSDMFGKVMALDDRAMFEVAHLSTLIPLDEIKELKNKNPKEAKENIAFEIVKLYHDEKSAKEAKREFEKVFSKGENPEDMPELDVGEGEINIVDLLIQADIESKSQAKRLINQGAVRLNDEKIEDFTKEINVKEGDILRVGKKRFFKIA